MQEVNPRVINLRAPGPPLILLCRILTLLSPFNRQMYANREFQPAPTTRDRRDQKFRFDTDTDTFSGSRSIPRLILILKVGLNRDRYWYWYQENVPGLILIPRLYLIRILPKPYKKCTSLWIDTGTDTETQKQPRSRPILILKALVSAFSIRYWYWYFCWL